MAESKTTTEKPNRNALPPTPLTGFLRYRRVLIFFAHIAVFAVSLMLAFLVSHNMQFRRQWLFEQYPLFIVLVLLVKIPVFWLFHQYRGWWRYVGIFDLLGILRASLVSTVLIMLVWSVGILNIDAMRRSLEPVADVSQGVFIADLFATILLLAGLRMMVRLYHEEFRTVESGRLKRFLIVGAGNAGEALLREIHRMQVAQYEVIGFVDDDPIKQGTNIHGIPVLGTVDELSQICADRNIEEIAIAMPAATHQQMRRVIQVCQGTKIRFRTVPSITDIASGKLRVSQIRDVDINDVLGREAVQLDLNTIEEFLRGKVILVTGAGGSIGSEMCRQVCQFEPKLLLLVEQAENPLFTVSGELNQQYRDVPMEPLVCDITDKNRVEEIFKKFNPEVVIHAAAHKHVPLMEINPSEAFKNNVLGTKVVADTSDRYGANNFVMISTDKAVNPTSLMGCSKRIAEIYIQDLDRTSQTHFVTVRFGNVLGSNGSVVPIFKRQIAAGGPVTVTHPEMQRYFMTIPEASQLVLQAATMGQQGEIFVLDMGEPVKIVDLARELITLSGFRPDEDIEIVFSGTRPGEKLFEELSIKGEDMMTTRHPKIGIWKNIPMDRTRLRAGIDKLIDAANVCDCESLMGFVRELVPEYSNNHAVPNTAAAKK